MYSATHIGREIKKLFPEVRRVRAYGWIDVQGSPADRPYVYQGLRWRRDDEDHDEEGEDHASVSAHAVAHTNGVDEQTFVHGSHGFSTHAGARETHHKGGAATRICVSQKTVGSVDAVMGRLPCGLRVRTPHGDGDAARSRHSDGAGGRTGSADGPVRDHTAPHSITAFREASALPADVRRYPVTWVQTHGRPHCWPQVLNDRVTVCAAYDRGRGNSPPIREGTLQAVKIGKEWRSSWEHYHRAVERLFAHPTRPKRIRRKKLHG